MIVLRGDFLIENKFNTPIAFIIFNRPDTTQLVFNEIRRIKPTKILIIGDGPRPERIGEAEKCLETRRIVEQIDWDCEVLKNYSELNLGCKKRVSSGLDWVFSEVEEAIILEDDCRPHPSFFLYCQELLEKYCHDERIANISGDNFQLGRKHGEFSYYFSRQNHIWGWATWRRAWRDYDVEMKLWPEVRDGEWLKGWLGNDPDLIRFWSTNFENTYQGKVDTWDYQWVFTGWINSRFTIIPQVNLISNIGFQAEATHTKNPNDSNANLAVEELTFPLIHPRFMIRDTWLDAFEEIDQKRRLKIEDYIKGYFRKNKQNNQLL
jgi:hypothetical protein